MLKIMDKLQIYEERDEERDVGIVCIYLLWALDNNKSK